MNTDEIIDALNEVEDTCIQNAREPKKKKSLKALWISAGAVAACIGVVLLLPRISHLIQHGALCDCIPGYKITPTPAVSTKYPLGLSYAGDFRERNNSGISFRESMISWPWEYNFICYQYPVVEYNGTSYRSRTFYTGDAVSESWIGTKLTDYVAGEYYSESEDSMPIHPTISCELYELKGVATERFLAVKYEGHEEYYVFMKDRVDPLDPLNPPATLGDLMTDLNLTETFPLTSFGYDSERYSLSETDSKALWELFSQYADRGTIMTDFAYRDLDLGKNVMTFTVDAEALGVYNRAWSLTSGGFLHTNIEDYGYYYKLGEDAVNELTSFALSHKKDALPKPDYTLIGEVTEITDDYIIVDDTICMKNPADGVKFTVELSDLCLERYVACNRLKVGDHVLIRHKGTGSARPTLIADAYELRIGRIDGRGELIIEESAVTEDSPSEPTATPTIHILE